MSIKTAFAVFAISIATLISPALARKPHVLPSPSAWTSSGRVIGHTAPGVDGVVEYLGIPFAQPPLNELRFAPPQPLSCPEKIIKADSFQYDCPVDEGTLPDSIQGRLRTFLEASSILNAQVSEDCLYLNVWAPRQQQRRNEHRLKPVMVWIYGGGFSTGGTNTTLYNGKHLAANEDIIVVSINYRVNIFGFPGAPELTQNAGLLDQRLALEWVRDNIKNFGGDPSLITIFGQSAGSGSVDIYDFAWTKDPIIAGSIMESGTIAGFGAHTAETAASKWYNASSFLGCGDASTGAQSVLNCMRSSKVTMDDLIKVAAPRAQAGNAVGTIFFPTIDEKTVFSDYISRLENKQFVQKPTLLGTTNYEAGLFILAGFPGLTPATADALDQSIFICPTSTAATGRTAAAPTWRYYYGGMFPNILIPTVNLTQAYHSAELGIVFGTAADASGEASTAAELALTKYIQGAWATFARDPSRGLDTYGWPRYDPASKTLIELGFDQSSTPIFVDPSTVDTSCGAYPYPAAGNV